MNLWSYEIRNYFQGDSIFLVFLLIAHSKRVQQRR